MKTITNKLLILLFLAFVQSGYTQGFVNLDFENATIVPDPSSPYYPYAVYASDAIPGWMATGLLGPEDVAYNNAALGSPNVSIFSTNGPNPQTVIDGAFSIYLQGGSGEPPTGASISQTAIVPMSAESILFKALNNGASAGTLLVSLGGQNISFFPISTESNYTLYGGNISSVLAGQSEQLIFSTLGGTYNNNWEIDDIQFSPSSVPEPSVFGLFAFGRFVFRLAPPTQSKKFATGIKETFGPTNVPTNVTNAIAVAAGGWQSLALLQNGTVVQWGQTNAPIPAGLTNVTAIACGTNFCLALLTNTTVVAWGVNNSGQTDVPTNLTNAVAIAAGGAHALALLQNGTIMAWGDNNYGETNVPANLTNAMAVAAGDAHCVALRNDGTVVCWGDNSAGQTNVFTNLPPVKLIAAGGNDTLAALFSPTVQYPVDVTRDLLLIYNTNSTDSATVLNYYLVHRPMVSNVNVSAGIGCVTNEITTNSDFTNQILMPFLNWLTANPTKRPEYVILFLGIPSRLQNPSGFGSVSYVLSESVPGMQPYVTTINMGGTNDCIAYINKLASMDTNHSLVISASAGGYGNTNYYFDNTGQLEIGLVMRQPIAWQSHLFENQHRSSFLEFDGLATWAGASISYIHPNASSHGPPTSSPVQVNLGDAYAGSFTVSFLPTELEARPHPAM